MSTREPATADRGNPPVCQVHCVHTEIVGRIQADLPRLQGAADFFKALADDTRLKIIHGLSQSELCVCDVATLIGGSKAAASYHLRLLYHMGLVHYRREGKLAYYRLADPRVRAVLQALIGGQTEREVER